MRSDVPPEIVHLARALAQFPAPGMTCAACQDELPAFVDAEMLGESGAGEYRGVEEHLDLCPACMSEYLGLLGIAWRLATDSSPRPTRVPPPALPFSRE